MVKTNFEGVKGTYINSNGEWAPAYYELSLTIQEDSERKSSNSPCIKIYDVAKRLNDITIEAKFKSDLLSNADISNTVMLHGMWLRGLYAGVKNYKTYIYFVQGFPRITRFYLSNRYRYI